MRNEHVIFLLMWLIGIVAFLVLIPRQKLREGLFALLAFKAFIWLFDMPAYEYDWLRSPIREMPKATDLPITIHTFLYPALFSIYYTQRMTTDSRRTKWTRFLVWVALIASLDLAIERYTDLLDYGKLSWYGAWIYFGLLFGVSQLCCDWFYKDQAFFKARRKSSV